jgi:hypothetical protein
MRYYKADTDKSNDRQPCFLTPNQRWFSPSHRWKEDLPTKYLASDEDNIIHSDNNKGTGEGALTGSTKITLQQQKSNMQQKNKHEHKHND